MITIILIYNLKKLPITAAELAAADWSVKNAPHIRVPSTIT